MVSVCCSTRCTRVQIHNKDSKTCCVSLFNHMRQNQTVETAEKQFLFPSLFNEDFILFLFPPTPFSSKPHLLLVLYRSLLCLLHQIFSSRTTAAPFLQSTPPLIHTTDILAHRLVSPCTHEPYSLGSLHQRGHHGPAAEHPLYPPT